jgi:osmotically-inducible protein OsmY
MRKVSSVLLGAALLATGALYVYSSFGHSPRETVSVTQVGYKGQEGMGHKAKEGLRDTTDALNITPRVKKAILEDGQLNDRRNLINVDTKDYVLHLKGHVYSQAIKARAGRVAAGKLAKMRKAYKLSNELTIGR